MKKTWVMDVDRTKADETLKSMGEELKKNYPLGNYVIGESKNGQTDQVGIYFEDPTANPQAEFSQ